MTSAPGRGFGRSEDSERVAARFAQVYELLKMKYADEDALLRAVISELLEAEVIFPGPSLYADPSV